MNKLTSNDDSVYMAEDLDNTVWISKWSNPDV